MARLNDLKMSTAERRRRRRRFSDNFKMQKVREIETVQTKISEICSQYQVTSKNVYLWVDKFGSMKNKNQINNSNQVQPHRDFLFYNDTFLNGSL